MRAPSSPVGFISAIVAIACFVGLAGMTRGQSQEPKPPLPATPVAGAEVTEAELPASGVVDSSWQGPGSAVTLSWDPTDWAVEAENIVPGYEGLQIGTPLSTVFIEVYEGFDGDADACLADAEREIGERPGLREVTSLEGRPLPVAEDERGSVGLFGLTATLEDGTPFRAVEYIECRSIIPGVSVAEITWQTAANSFNVEFPLVEELLGSLTIPAAPTPAGTPTVPAATPTVPLATPVA